MKAVLFAGGECPNLDDAAPFLEGATFIAAADSGLLAAKRAGCLPNLIIGDMDSLPNGGLVAGEGQAEVIRLESAKDLSDTEAALRLLRMRGFSDITLVGAGGGRLDHLIAVLRLFETDFAPSLWLAGVSAAAFLRSAETLKLVASGLETGDLVSVFAVGEAPHKIEGENLKWSLDIPWDDGDKSRPVRDSLSNWAQKETVTLSPVCGDYLCVFPLKKSLKLERLPSGLLMA